MIIWIVNHYAIPPSMGGLVRHYYFSKYLSEKGHTVRIITSSKIHNTEINMINDKTLFLEKEMDGVEYTFVKSKDYSGNGVDRIINMINLPFAIWKTMKKIYKTEKPDVIYTSSPDLFVAFSGLLFGKNHKIPVISEIRDLWPQSVIEYKDISPNNPVMMIMFQLEKYIYSNSKKIIFTMPGGKDYIFDKKWDKKIQISKIEHVNNGVDINEFEYNKKHYIFEDANLDNKNTFKVVYVGSIRYVNNLHTLIDAAKVLKEEGYDEIEILIYGDGTERKALEDECKQNNLNVYFKGRVDKKYIPYILSKSDLNIINVMSAKINKYGCSWNKLFEYLASGKPILSNLVVEHDLIKKYNAGISRNYSTSKSYADDILKFTKMDEKEYINLCDNAKAASLKYDYKKLADEIELVCQKCM